MFAKASWIPAALIALAIPSLAAPPKHRHSSASSVSSSDPTGQLYQLLDSSYGGKLKDFYVLGDVYPDTAHAGSFLQHVLRLVYDKNRYFGRWRIYVRSIGKPTEGQLKTYTLEQLYDFGEVDLEEFEKINPGRFGQTGDLYLESPGANEPLASATINDGVIEEYDKLVSQYVLPALQKK